MTRYIQTVGILLLLIVVDSPFGVLFQWPFLLLAKFISEPSGCGWECPVTIYYQMVSLLLMCFVYGALVLKGLKMFERANSKGALSE